MFKSKKLIVLYEIVASHNGIHDTFYLANMGGVSNANTSIVSAWMQVHWGYKKCLGIIAYITEYKTNLEVTLGKNMQIPCIKKKCKLLQWNSYFLHNNCFV